MLLSLVRNNKAGHIGFLKMRNRVNVLLSRARHCLILLGNAASLEANKARAPMWPQVLDMLDQQSRVGQALQVGQQARARPGRSAMGAAPGS